MSKKSSIVVAAMISLFSLVTIMWLSCTKGTNAPSCRGVVCENAGYCVVDTINSILTPECACPSGYEGPTCATASVTKYLGTWSIHQHINWSDSSSAIGKDSSYTVLLQQTSTNTTFFIDNFFNNQDYNEIICDIDSPGIATQFTTNYFTIDTLSDFHELYDHYQVKWGVGTISGNTINASMFIRFKNGSTNWQQDSLTLTLTKL